eukprot:m.237405 g.237405  ORF g.237405 m.237405 type:complete len:231 (-) comp13132_c0_seq1:178-870(-)
MAAAPGKKTISPEEWGKALDGIEVDKGLLDRAILQHLISEGYKEAAEEMMAELGIHVPVDTASLDQRSQVRGALHRGDVQSAIDKVNELSSETFDRNTELFFQLNIQQLIEHIRGGNIPAALDFARTELATLGSENPALLERLEEAMALLAFKDRSSCPVSHLLSPSQRQIMASKVNAALQSQPEADPSADQLLGLLRAFVWAQNQLGTRATFPVMQSSGAMEPPPAPTS